jgi:hypothetical protein
LSSLQSLVSPHTFKEKKLESELFFRATENSSDTDFCLTPISADTDFCKTVVHLCCCGCRREVVTPLSPTDWKLIFDGMSISLYPSIGNWTFPCRSHYWIQCDRAQWAEDWTQEEIEVGRTADTLAKARYFEREAGKPEPPAPAPKVKAERTTPKERGWLKAFKRVFGT